ncbi:MAG: phosphatase PAP2 family protein [Prevotella sp.]|nr:phosphatase PAP2 family protein [Prevotella sp.]
MSHINDIDQYLLLLLNGSDSLFLDRLMTFLTTGMTWIPLYLALLYMVVKNNETMGQILLAAGCAIGAVLLTASVDNLLVKPLVARPRPCNEVAIKYMVDVVYRLSDRDFSFFSAHAANTSSLAVFFILLVRHKLFTIAMIAWSLVNCYTRLYLGFHYPSDILCGLLFGSLVGFVAYLVYLRIFNKISPESNFVSSHYTKTGYAISDIDVVLSVLVYILLFCIVSSLVTSL